MADTFEQVARHFNVSVGTVRRWKRAGCTALASSPIDLAAVAQWRNERRAGQRAQPAADRPADDESPTSDFWSEERPPTGDVPAAAGPAASAEEQTGAAAADKAKGWFHWTKYVQTVAVFVMGTFVWPIFNYWISQPDLTLEVVAIGKAPRHDHEIRLEDYPQVEACRREFNDNWAKESLTVQNPLARGVVTYGTTQEELQQVDDLIQQIADTLASLARARGKWDLEKDKDSAEAFAKLLKTDLAIMDQTDFEARKPDIEGDLQREYLERVRKENLASQLLEEYRTKIKPLLEQLKKDADTYALTAILVNSGGTSISINGDALLRIYATSDEYHDVELELVGEDGTTADSQKVPAKDTVTIRLESTANQEDTQAYWDHGHHAYVFVRDATQKVCVSDDLVFAPIRYRKSVFTSLRKEADNSKYFRSP